jgi:hypothetical protein
MNAGILVGNIKLKDMAASRLKVGNRLETPGRSPRWEAGAHKS